MSAEGWKLENIGVLLWKYTRCSPEKKKYEVIFSKDNPEFEELSKPHHLMLYSLCEEGGWKKEGQWRNMQIFSNADEEAEPLVTDESIRLNSIRRAMKGSYVLNNLMVFVCTLIVFQNNFNRYLADQTESYLWASIFTAYACAVTAIMLVMYGIWVRLSERSIANGGSCADARWINIVQNIILWGIFVLAAVYGILMKESMFKIISLIVICFLAVGCVGAIPGYMKGKGVSKTANILISLTLGVIILLIYVIVTVIMMNT